MKTFSLFNSPFFKRGLGGILLALTLTLPLSAQFGTGFHLRNVKTLPADPVKGQVVQHSDTLKVYTGTGGWKSLYEAGYPDASANSVLFYDASGCACWRTKELVDITDSIIATSATTPFTAANVNNGDILELAPTPGTGKSIIPYLILIHTEGITAASGTDNSFFKLGTNNLQTVTVGQLGLDGEYTTYFNNFPVTYAVTFDPTNKALNLDFGDDYSGTNRTGWIEVWYYIVTHP